MKLLLLSLLITGCGHTDINPCRPSFGPPPTHCDEPRVKDLREVVVERQLKQFKKLCSVLETYSKSIIARSDSKVIREALHNCYWVFKAETK
jgi:hypothetical protein